MPRVVVTISLPKELNLRIKKRIKENSISKSEYFRNLVKKNLMREKSFLKREKKIIAQALKAAKKGRVSKIFNRREVTRYLRGL